MDKKMPRPMTPFDLLTVPDDLYSIKLFLPYTPVSMQRFLAIYVKFIELHHTITYFHGFPSRSPSSDMMADLKPYLSEKERSMMEQAENMMHMMEMWQSMQSMADASDPDMNPMDFMKTMLTPEQQEMFDMYSQMFDTDMNMSDSDTKKGGSTHERMDGSSGNEEHRSNKT